MQLPLFPSYPRCSNCSLGCTKQRLLHKGIPTRICDSGAKPGLTKAVLLVGAYPGRAEDRTGRCYVGDTGKHMNNTYCCLLKDLADCYLTNAVRCFPRGVKTISPADISACNAYLVDDIELLKQHYEEVIVVCCGSEAITSVLGKQCAIGSFPQGRQQKVGSQEVVCFGTYLPAMLLRKRDPAKFDSIKEHLLLVRRWLRTGQLHPPLLMPKRCYGSDVADPPTDCGVLSIDIETYGAVKALPVQRCFQPTGSTKIDQCPPAQLIQTVALAWHQDAAIHCKAYRWQVPEDRRRLVETLLRIQPEAWLSNNVQFDISYLRTEPELRAIFSQERGPLLYDLMVVSFLENDQRPERSLKNLVVLLGIDDYYDEPVDLRKGQRYATGGDPRLLRYNAKDAAATLACYDACTDGIMQRYGKSTAKWSPACRQHYSDLLWLALEMSENGIAVNRKDLMLIHERLEWRLEVLRRWGLDHDLLMDNAYSTGSKGSQQRLIDRLVAAYRPRGGAQQREFDRLLLLTDKKREISTKDVNLTLVRGVIPRRHEDFRTVRRLQNFRKLFKLQTSYVNPMLAIDSDNIESQLVDGLVHPRWHVIPSKWSENAKKEREGGQRQARLSAQDPPVQTQPDFIRATQESRYPGGCRIWCDLSQIELRVPVIYSGDPVMLQLFKDGVSLHARTASEICGHEVKKKAEPMLYDAGKHINFLRVYGGEADKAQSTWLLLTRQQLPTEHFRIWLQQDKLRYPVFYAWQASLYETAQRLHRLELPITGLSRSFRGDVRVSYYSEVLSFPVQGLAAILCQSAQIAAHRELRLQGSRCLSNENIHDAGGYDCPPDEKEQVSALLLECFRNPPILSQLVELGYFPCPLDAELKIVDNRSPT